MWGDEAAGTAGCGPAGPVQVFTRLTAGLEILKYAHPDMFSAANAL
jgi:hypothetical protein